MRPRAERFTREARAALLGKTGRQDDVDAVETADLSERLLCSGEVHEEDRARRRARRADRAQHGGDAKAPLDASDDERQEVPGMKMISFCEYRRDQHRILLEDREDVALFARK